LLFKLAWRNIWRNSRRSIIVIGSVVVGVIALLLIDSLDNGFLNQMLFNQISSNVAHIQIHKKGFNNNKKLQSFVPGAEKVDETLANEAHVKHFSKRVIAFGLLSSASNSSGIYIYGVNPGKEKFVSYIHQFIVKGKYFTGGEREIVIGEKLARKLKVSLGDKVVALANTPSGSIGSEVFRVVGIFKTPNSEFDKIHIYIPIRTAQKMLDIGNNFHEYAIILDNYKNAKSVAADLKNKLDAGYEVFSYEDILPLLLLQLDLFKEMMFIINLIVGLALIFGIINAMLMSVFERIQEIGVLMSIGMKNIKIFLMIVFEAIILGVSGTILGIILGYALTQTLAVYGIDLSIFSDSLTSFGVGSIIYPILSLDNLIVTLFMIPFVSVIGAIYPAIKAIRLEPVNAIRYI